MAHEAGTEWVAVAPSGSCPISLARNQKRSVSGTMRSTRIQDGTARPRPVSPRVSSLDKNVPLLRRSVACHSLLKGIWVRRPDGAPSRPREARRREALTGWRGARGFSGGNGRLAARRSFRGPRHGSFAAGITLARWVTRCRTGRVLGRRSISCQRNCCVPAYSFTVPSRHCRTSTFAPACIAGRASHCSYRPWLCTTQSLLTVRCSRKQKTSSSRRCGGHAS